MGKIFSYISISCLILVSPMSYALNCEPLDPRQQVGKKVEQSIEGSAKVLFKVIGGEASYKSKTQEEVKNLYQNYPNADKLVIQGKLIYTFCTVLNEAEDMKSSEKLEKLNSFMAVLIEPVNNEEASTKKERSKYVVESDEFVFELKKCKASGSAIRCYFVVTNVGPDRDLKIYGRHGRNTSRIFLDSGDEVLAVKSQLGAWEKNSYVNVNLMSGVPVKASLYFKTPNLESNKIAAIDLRTKNSSVQFRSIDIVN